MVLNGFVVFKSYYLERVLAFLPSLGLPERGCMCLMIFWVIFAIDMQIVL